MCLCRACPLPSFLALFMVFTMIDFPENLEDGEKWLPFDVYQEIMSDKFNHKAAFGNPFKGCATHVLDKSISPAFKTSSTGLLGAKVNPARVFGNEVSKRVRSSYDFGSVSRVFYSYILAAWTHTQVGVFEHGSTRISRRYSRGTGVFIPRVINGINEYKPLQGRDSFAVSPASVCIMEKRWKNLRQVPEKKESDEICLPEEWTY